MTTRLDRVRLMVAQGYSNAEIASTLGLRSTRQVTRLRRQAEIPSPFHPPLTEDQRKEILRLSEEEGWPPEEIATTLGIHYTTAYVWGVRGPGLEWSNTASRLAVKYPKLWRELRNGM